jgi:hemerythrin-like domain-containing protein
MMLAMRRMAELAPFSADHHHELVQARRLLQATDATPGDRLETARAYVTVFFAQTVEHFRREEEQLFPLYVRHAGRTALLERILDEHMQLHGLVRALRTHVVAGNVEPEEVAILGTLLRDHVRAEERELFEHLQQVVSEHELRALEA